MNKKINILHYNDVFFEKSETFIYNYIVNLKIFEPILFARKFENFDLFPFLDKNSFTMPAKFPNRYSPGWLSAKFCQKLFDTHFTGEEIFCREHKIKLIHAHFAPQGFFAVNWFERKTIPVVTNFYGFDVSELPNDPLWAKRLKILFEKGSLFLVEGQFMFSKLIQIGCPEKRIQIQRIAIPLDKLIFRKRQPKSRQEKAVFLFCGRFVEKKGLRYVLEAFAQVKRSNKDFEFRVIGDGPLKEEIKALVERFELSENVTLLGFLNYQQYIAEMNNADIFIHPSVTAQSGDSEGGAPTVILEAQAMGLPVIATTHADIPNVVKPQQSALLSAERDVPGLVNNIMHILNNQHLWEEMGRSGRAFVEEFHDVKKEVLSLERKYQEVIL